MRAVRSDRSAKSADPALLAKHGSIGAVGLGLALLCVACGDDHVANSPASDGPIVAFGDSLTEGVGAGRADSYPEQLSKLLGREVLNRGVSGETAGQALRRVEADVLDEDPAVVIVLLGGNDLLQRIDPDQTFNALEKIVVACIESGALTVLVGIEGLPLISADFGARFKELAKRTGCLYVPDILDGITGKPNLMADGIHPNGEGYAIVAGRIAKALEGRL